MNYVEEYQRKARNIRLICLGVMLAGILLFIIGMCSTEALYNAGAGAVIGICASGGWASFFIGLGFLCNTRVAWRKYNGHYIIFYNGFIHGYLIIDGEVEAVGGAFQTDLYAQLPDGTDVHVNCKTANTKFAIGHADNHNISFI